MVDTRFISVFRMGKGRTITVCKKGVCVLQFLSLWLVGVLTLTADPLQAQDEANPVSEELIIRDTVEEEADAPSPSPDAEASPTPISLSPNGDPSSPFIPVKPGEAPPREFQPSAIAPPAIQSTPETSDLIEDAPTPAPRSTPRPETRRRASDAELIRSGRLAETASSARRTRSAPKATQLGWAYYNAADFESSALWFEQALEWAPDSGEAAYGLALSKFRLDDIAQAEAIAGYRLDSYPKMKTLMGDILARRAIQFYEAREFDRAIEKFLEASNFRKLSRNEEIVLAWCYLSDNQPHVAAERFERLYRKLPDEQAAEGLYTSLRRIGQQERMVAMDGPIADLYETYEAKAYYESGLYRAAYSEAPGDFPILDNLTEPSFTIGASYRQKSGQSGESQLETVRAPIVELKVYPSNQTELTFRLARMELDTGELAQGAVIGKFPEQFEFFSFEPTTNINDLYEFRVRLEHQDWITPYIEVGTTPINGTLDPVLVGNAGVIYRWEKGYVQGELYRESVRQSMLSYVGIVDPYQGEEWGRVTETGGSASFFYGFLPSYTIFANFSYGVLDGTNVQQNERLTATVALAKEISYEGFEYITIGPAFSVETYANNQNFFTYGHGGYFSPSYIAQGLLGANFLTREGTNWIAQGSIGVGYQTNEQASAPLFPLDPDGRTYPGTESSTGIFISSLDVALMLSPEWVVGSSMGYNITADYNEGFASIYLRYLFEPRPGLLRDDLRPFY